MKAPLSRSERHARRHARDKGAPPHHLRCEYVDEQDRRCIKCADHPDEHEFPQQ